MLPCQHPSYSMITINTFSKFSKDFNGDTVVAGSFNEKCMCGIKELNVAQSL